MDVWRQYVGKKIFLRTNKDRVYSGVVKEIDDSNRNLIFISLIDIKGRLITILSSEITEIKEEI